MGVWTYGGKKDGSFIECKEVWFGIEWALVFGFVFGLLPKDNPRNIYLFGQDSTNTRASSLFVLGYTEETSDHMSEV